MKLNILFYFKDQVSSIFFQSKHTGKHTIQLGFSFKDYETTSKSSKNTNPKVLLQSSESPTESLSE